MTIQEINNNFTYHSPNSEQLPRYAELREKARLLALDIYDLTPISAEQTIAIRKLEEAIFYANAAIARNS